MPVKYVCSECGEKYDPTVQLFRCECGGLFDLEKFDFTFSKNDILHDQWSLFRYLKALPFDEGFQLWKDITMGEGMTPIVPLEKENPDLLVKVDYMMPTLSFKDRGAAVLIAKAKELGVKKVIQDSSGNAGNSIAAYAGRAGMACDIYVPEGTSEKKIKQIFAHGAKVCIVKGTREDTAKEALRAAERGDGFYASHVYNPFFYQGTKTYAYEIYEQLNGDMPEALVIPVGNGTLLLGAYYGCKELLHLNLIEKLPRIIAVQTEGCNPIYKAFMEGKDVVEEVENTGTIAEGIAIAKPMRGKQILEAIRNTAGEMITAPEERIMETQKDLAQKGFYVEPTTAATFAAYFQYCEEGKNAIKGKVLIPLCGAGLKSK
ncbi:MAG: threonine synthase [Bacillota bacterium]